jgi:hypothetical protein
VEQHNSARSQRLTCAWISPNTNSINYKTGAGRNALPALNKSTKAMTTIRRFYFRLNTLHSQVLEQIASELERIARVVSVDELTYNPFEERIAGFTDAIELTPDGNVTVHTSFRDIATKTLKACIADEEINSYSLIALLESLMKIEK